MSKVQKMSALTGTAGQSMPQFFPLILNRMRLYSLTILGLMALWSGLYNPAWAQNQFLSPADTFVHAATTPIFELENAWMPPSTHLATVKLTTFPAVHVRKVTLVCTFAQPLAVDAQLALSISNWQPFPERFGLTWRVEAGRLMVCISSPIELDLQPNVLLTIRWEVACQGLPMPTAILKIDGIVLTENIDGFRQSWLPPQRWIEKGSNDR